MRRTDRRTTRGVAVLVLSLGLALPGSGWAQEAAGPAPATDLSARQVLASLAAGVGSLFYGSFKAVVICPGAALVSGASLAVTRGDRVRAEQVLRIGCTGTYLITPGMVRGQAEFQGTGSR